MLFVVTFVASTHTIARYYRFETVLMAKVNNPFSPIVIVYVGFFLNLNFRSERRQRHPFFIVIRFLNTKHDISIQTESWLQLMSLTALELSNQ